VSRPDYYGNPAGVTQDIDIVRTIYAAFAARDVDAVIALAAPDCELRLDGTARAIHRTEPYRGHDGVREYFADVERLWDELTLQADDIRTVPGSVIVLGQVEGRRDGATLRRRAMWTWRLREGRVVSIRVSDLGDLGA
jgi:ketosteroid isomerase-like protein